MSRDASGANLFLARTQAARHRGMNCPAESPKSPLMGTLVLCPRSASADFERLSGGIHSSAITPVPRRVAGESD